MIAVDCMGGDQAPAAQVSGAHAAAQQGIPVLLCGDQARVRALLDSCDSSWSQLPISFLHTSQVIAMHHEPMRAVRQFPDSSLVQAVRAVVQGRAQAIVSAGNSGAAVVAATVLLGRLSGVARPALGAYLPTRDGVIFCLDVGANADCKPEHLVDFAYMGSAYVGARAGLERPRVVLLANGTETLKGSQGVRQAHALLKQAPINFLGNAEPADLMAGCADVVVCDGFIGNILIKSLQAMAGTMQYWLKQAVSQSPIDSLVFGWRADIFRQLKQRVTTVHSGGALLLGIQQPCVIAHGCSDAAAMTRAIRSAHEAVQSKTVSAIAAQLPQRTASVASNVASAEAKQQKTPSD